MIPSIRNRINQANRAIEDRSGDGDRDGSRVDLPPEEIKELGELRKRERCQRAREEHNAKLAEAEEKVNLIQEQENAIDLRREFGLPKGLACMDIWEKILRYIIDPEDIIRIAQTCQLFWGILKGKYKAVRLTEMALLLRDRESIRNLDELMVLRQVCHSSKTAVDRLFLTESIDSWWWPDNFCEDGSDWFKQWIPKHWMVLSINWLQTLQNRLTRCLEMDNVPDITFPMKSIHYYEFWAHQDNPQLVVLRTLFKQLLGFIGRSVTEFNFDCCEDTLGTYNQLRSWVVLMPNLVNLEVCVHGGQGWDALNPPVLELQPFPPCPGLKRFTNHGSGLASPFLAEIFRANPSILEVRYFYDEPLIFNDEGWQDGHVQEFGAVLNTLDMLPLEWLNLYGERGNPPLQFLEFRFRFPLKQLTLTVENEDGSNRDLPSGPLFAFINSFSATLEDVTMTWKIHDTGGYLDVPKVSKLLWKFWPEFTTFDFMVALENLQFLDLHIGKSPQITEATISERTLPGLFPGLRKIRVTREWQTEWEVLWKP